MFQAKQGKHNISFEICKSRDYTNDVRGGIPFSFISITTESSSHSKFSKDFYFQYLPVMFHGWLQGLYSIYVPFY